MASTFSPLLRAELIATGEQSGTWGTTTNSNLQTVLEAAIAGTSSIAIAGASTTLTTANNAADQARNAILSFSGVLGAASVVIVPSSSKLYLVYNGTSGAYTLTVKTSGGTGVAVPQGSYQWVYCDGTNVQPAGAPTANPTFTGTLTAAAVSATTGVFSSTVSATQLTSTIATGTAPLVVTSTTPVANLSIGGNAATATTSTAVTGTIASSTTATTQAAGDNSTKVATTAYVDAVGPQAGEVRETFRTTAPSGWYLLPNAAQAAVPRSGTYANINALMSTLGYPFGAGDGVTTFVMPWIPTGYTWVQAVSATTAGALTHGKIKDHAHGGVITSGGPTGVNASASFYATLNGNTGNPVAPEGGADNLAAGIGINYILKL